MGSGTSGTSGTGVEGAREGARLPWVDILLSAIAAVSWALIGMAGTAALGLHLLRADAAGSLGPMTAAVVALGAGGSVTPNGDLSAFGLKGAEATTAIEITPLGVSLAGALLLSWFFLRSLRTAGVVVAPAELLARAGSVVVLFVATLGGLAWAGHSVVTIDGGALGLDGLTGAGGGGGGGGGGLSIPGIGDVGGLLPHRLGDLVKADAAVGFRVDTAATLAGGLAWCTGVLLIALLASRRTPLPRGWEAVHRAVRPAASALVTVLLVAVAAGWTAAAYAAIGDPHPARIAGAALLGAPNGVWLGVPVGLLVPFDGRATGVLTAFLPHPLDDFLTSKSDRSVTLGHLAELDGRVWLLGVAAALLMLLAGVFTAVRTPVGRGTVGRGAVGRGDATGPWEGAGRVGVRSGAFGFAGRCAVRLGTATALTLPLLAWLTGVSVDASLSVLGFDAFGAGIELHGQLGMALLLGAAWGAAAGAAGALLAWATGAAGSRAAPQALGGAEYAGAGGADGGPAHPEAARAPGGPGGGPAGPYAPVSPYRPPNPGTNPYLRLPDGLRDSGDGRDAWPEWRREPHRSEPGASTGPWDDGTPEPGAGARPWNRGAPEPGADAGPWDDGTPEPGAGARPWNRGAPEPGGFGSYDRPAASGQGPEPGVVPSGGSGGPGARGASAASSGDAPLAGSRRSSEETRPGTGGDSSDVPPGSGDVYGAPTMARPIGPPPRSPRPRAAPRRGDGTPDGPNAGPPPPPPPPPPPRRRPKR
ncbi:streptophobe family protein [Streptomyces sp. NPDC007851]|uniref:streptophobe family protein n=1 Tax=Streptomyces sp. NPDC007851 TaxID=3155008 RepID=UPI003400B69E